MQASDDKSILASATRGFKPFSENHLSLFETWPKKNGILLRIHRPVVYDIMEGFIRPNEESAKEDDALFALDYVTGATLAQH